eukprot:scaffold31020_cov160-Skeletonema_menzelii.AAC.4
MNIFISTHDTFLSPCLPQSVSFKEECLHKPKDECIDAINARVLETPAIFGNPHVVNYDVRKIREETDEGYNLVSLRTNMDTTTIGGLLGDGMIWYPYEWCLAADNCYTIGPWDCDVGIPLTKEECCKMIKDSVPTADMNGNYLECYFEYPVGTSENPVQTNRIIIHTDANDVVVHIPKNE